MSSRARLLCGSRHFLQIGLKIKVVCRQCRLLIGVVVNKMDKKTQERVKERAQYACNCFFMIFILAGLVIVILLHVSLESRAEKGVVYI